MSEIKRKQTRVVKVGNVVMVGNSPIVIQSMCNCNGGERMAKKRVWKKY